MHPIEKLARDPSSPYWQDGGDPLPRRSVVAFVDILGFTDQVRAAKDEGAALVLLHRLRHALNDGLVHLDQNWPEWKGALARRLWDHKAFTDNIVIGYPIRDDGESELGSVFATLGMFQLTMIQAGFFVRGSIAIGDLYMDRDIVFGSGLLEAYEAEQSIARDPRIVLAESAVECVERHLQYYAHPVRAPQNRDLSRDADGRVFINYLDSILVAEDDHGPIVEPLLDHKREVEKGLEAYRPWPRVWSKYYWAASYHNYFCSTREYFTDEHRIDLAAFAPSMAPLVD